MNAVLRRALPMIVAAVLVACGTPTSPPTSSPTDAPQRSGTPSPTAGPTAAAATAPIAEGWIVYQAAGGLAKIRPNGTDQQVIVDSGRAPEPAHADWSPDGSRISFQAGRPGSWDIWIANADGSDARVLVDCVDPCINLDGPAWSPDGTRIAFIALDEVGDELPGSLSVVDVASGEVSAVVMFPSGDYASTPRWAPDGRRIAVAYEQHRASGGGLVENPLASTIAIVDLDAPSPTFEPLAGVPPNASYPDWHPSLDVIAFQAGSNIWWEAISQSASNIYTVRVDGSDLRQITSLGPNDRAVWLPTWTIDGGAILVTLTERGSRDNTLAWLSSDGSQMGDLPGPIGGAHPRQ